VLDNPYLKNFHFLPQIFGSTVWSFVGMQGVSNYYRPMMTFGYAVCYHVFGPLAYGFHLVNVCLHVGVVLLVFVVGRRIFKSRAAAFLAALLLPFIPSIRKRLPGWLLLPAWNHVLLSAYFLAVSEHGPVPGRNFSMD